MTANSVDMGEVTNMNKWGNELMESGTGRGGHGHADMMLRAV